MYNEAKLKSLQELLTMLDGETLGKLKKPGALPEEALGGMPPAAEEGIPGELPIEGAPEQDDQATLQALMEAYGKEDEELPPV